MTEFLALCRNSSRRAPHGGGVETVTTKDLSRGQRAAPDRSPNGVGRQVQFASGLGDGHGHQGAPALREPASGHA
jgi:hypothetical protein